jgi:hypothetical protein
MERRAAQLAIGAAVKRVPVKSGHIAAIGYDPAARVLEVEFRTGLIYQYFDVDANTHAELVGAESIGKAFTAIRGSYKFHALTLDDEQEAQKKADGDGVV